MLCEKYDPKFLISCRLCCFLLSITLNSRWISFIHSTAKSEKLTDKRYRRIVKGIEASTDYQSRSFVPFCRKRKKKSKQSSKRIFLLVVEQILQIVFLTFGITKKPRPILIYKLLKKWNVSWVESPTVSAKFVVLSMGTLLDPIRRFWINARGLMPVLAQKKYWRSKHLFTVLSMSQTSWKGL